MWIKIKLYVKCKSVLGDILENIVSNVMSVFLFLHHGVHLSWCTSQCDYNQLWFFSCIPVWLVYNVNMSLNICIGIFPNVNMWYMFKVIICAHFYNS